MPKTKSELIRSVSLKETSPDQSKCPELIQHWNSSTGVIYWSNKTGHRTITIPNNNIGFHWTLSVKPEYSAAYVKYHKSIDAIEFAFIIIKGGRGKEGFPKNWEYDKTNYYMYHDGRWVKENRVFLFRDDMAPYDEYGNHIWEKYNGKYYNHLMLTFVNELSKLYSYNMTYDKEFSQFCGTEVIKTRFGSSNEFNRIYQFVNWYKSEFTKRDSRKKMELSDYNDLLDKRGWEEKPWPNYIDKNNRWHGVYSVYFEIFDDYEYCVFRIGTNIRETNRVFISEKGKPTCMENYSNSWHVVTTIPRMGGYWLMPSDEEMSQWKNIKWLLPCVQRKENDDYGYGNGNNPIAQIITMLRHPCLETISKSNYPYIAKGIAANGTVAANLKNYFGVAKEPKKGNVSQIIGINKLFLKKVEEHAKELNERDRWSYDYGAFRIVSLAKEIFGPEVMDWSEEKLNLYYKPLKALKDTYNWRGYMFNIGRWGDQTLTDEQKEQLKAMLRKESKYEGILRLFSDTMAVYNRLRNKPEMDIMGCTDFNDLQRMHNSLVELLNIQNAEDRARWNASEKERMEKDKKKFEKLQEDRVEKFEYDGNDFCIRMPKSLEEIPREGSLLHHCVGGYVSRHANGETNIIFLRKKSSEDSPFYTIEIKGNQVIQIHGLYNRWLGNNPEAVPFVYEWLNHLGVNYSKDMLLNKAAGYSKSKDSLPESALFAS